MHLSRRPHGHEQISHGSGNGQSLPARQHRAYRHRQQFGQFVAHVARTAQVGDSSNAMQSKCDYPALRVSCMSLYIVSAIQRFC